MAERRFSTGDILNPSGARLLGVGADGGTGVLWTGAIRSRSGGPVVVGALGDSLVGNSVTTSNAHAATLGTTRTFNGRCWMQYAANMCKGVAYCDSDAVEGYGGYKAGDIYVSQLGVSSTRTIGPSGNTATIPFGVLSVKPDVCLCLVGTNDLLQDKALDYARQGWLSIWDRLLRNGIIPIAISLCPICDTAAHRLLVPTWNRAIHDDAIRVGIPFIDVYSRVSNADGSWITGYAYNGAIDNVHPGNDGALVIADEIAKCLRGLIHQSGVVPSIYSSGSPVLSVPWDATTKAAAFALGESGLFESVTWSQYNNHGAPTMTVSAGGIASSGNTLNIDCPSSEGQGNWYAAKGKAATVTPGGRYIFFCKASVIPGNAGDSIEVGVQAGATTGTVIARYSLPGAYSYALGGIQQPEINLCLPFVAPPGITSCSPWVSVVTAAGTGVARVSIAQMGFARIG